MKYILYIIILVNLTINSDQVIKNGPFKNVDLTKLNSPVKEIIISANEDFHLVLNYYQPKHSKLKTVFKDGGTSIYKGEGYTLIVDKKISFIGKNLGYIYGPKIIFDDNQHNLNRNNIQYTKFYLKGDLESKIESVQGKPEPPLPPPPPPKEIENEKNRTNGSN